MFISYATVDGTGHATRLDRELSRRGVHTWLSGRDIDEASDFTAQLERAIGRADRLVVCITRDVRREDSYVRREIAFA